MKGEISMYLIDLVRPVGLVILLFYYDQFPEELSNGNLYISLVWGIVMFIWEIMFTVILQNNNLWLSSILMFEPFGNETYSINKNKSMLTRCLDPILSVGHLSIFIFNQHIMLCFIPYVLYFSYKYKLNVGHIIFITIPMFIVNINLTLITAIVAFLTFSLIGNSFYKLVKDKNTILTNGPIFILGMGLILAHHYNYPEQIKLNLFSVLYSICIFYCINIFGTLLLRFVGHDNLVPSDNNMDIYKYIKKISYIDMISCVWEESLFIPLYIDYFDVYGKIVMAIILSAVFGALHIMSRRRIVFFRYFIAILIQQYFHHGIINSMVGHYLYNLSMLFLDRSLK